MSLLVVAPRVACGQAGVSSALTVSADILFPAVSAGGARPLNFGAVVPGTTVSVAPRTSQGAEFRITGLLGHRSVDITLTLPSTLDGPGGATIPLSASLTSWDPVVSPTTRVRPAKLAPGAKVFMNDQLALYLGGSVTPAATQRAGHYTASATVVIVAN
jgi:hypothetical protein